MRISHAAIGALLLLLLAVLGWAAVSAVTPPAARPATAPDTEFSAGRAVAHVQQISTERHPAGSPAAAKVRNYLVDQLRGLGLDPQIQDAIGADDALGGYAMARVQNVVAVIPGTASTGRIFLMAHYDSVQVSLGANDDGAGTATLLETARALRAGPALRNDIVLVFTDAEEACLCGAEAFLGHPLAADGGVVLNFEARGSSGPAVMFETTRNNADLVGVYGSAVPYPVATSFAVEVYRILPNDTDFSPFRDSGRFTGLNTAYIDGSAAYHSPQDRAQNLSADSLQHHGSNALALARSLGAADVAVLRQPSDGDATYFPVLGTLVRYPGAMVWPIAVVGLLGCGVLGWLLVRRGVAGVGRLAAGFGLALVPLVVAVAAAQAYYPLLKLFRPGYANLDDPWSPGWYRVAVLALVVALVLGWYSLLRNRFGRWALTLGALGWLSILGVGLAAFAPGGSYLASVPALAGVAAGSVALLARPGWVAALSAWCAGAVGVLVLAPTVYLFFPALGLAAAAAPALFAVLLLLVLLPTLDYLLPATDSAVADPRRTEPAVADPPVADPPVADPPVADPPRSRRRLRTLAPSLTAAVLLVLSTTIGLLVDRFDADHPAPVQLMYAMDTDTGQAYWVRPGEDPTGWTDEMVSAEQDLSAAFPLLPAETTVGPAAPAPLEAPSVRVTTDRQNADGTRSLTLTIEPQRVSRLLYLQLPTATVLSARAAGREVPIRDPAGSFDLLFHAVPPGGLVLDLVLEDSSPVAVRVMDGSDDLSVLPGFVPRPNWVGIEGSHTSEMTLVATTVTV